MIVPASATPETPAVITRRLNQSFRAAAQNVPDWCSNSDHLARKREIRWPRLRRGLVGFPEVQSRLFSLLGCDHWAAPPVWRRDLPGKTDVVRTMYLAYWLMIVGGIVLWIAVGLTVQ